MMQWRYPGLAVVLLVAPLLATAGCSTPTGPAFAAVDASTGDGSVDAVQAPEDTEDSLDAADATDPADAEPADTEAPVEDVADVADVPEDVPSVDADAGDGDADGGADVVSCKPGTQTCKGALLATCSPKGDGYTISKCFPGTACTEGVCKPVNNNLLLIFDTSGSMSTPVTKKDGSSVCSSGANYSSWPKCEDPVKFPDGCTRLGVSKSVFLKALAKLDDQVSHMGLFRFPQTGGTCSASGSCSCTSGGFDGQTELKGDLDAQSVTEASNWFWSNLGQIACVPFPKVKGEKTKVGITQWMDNVQDTANPELRATGGTPIGKSLFYIGEYIRNRVVVDGKVCKIDSDCGNANYLCDTSACKTSECLGKCKDPARSCRDTIVVLFTDGGETSVNSYFGPWIQAKRMSMGLGCKADTDCVGGATCEQFSECMPGGSFGSEVLGSGRQCSKDSDCIDDKTGQNFGACKPFQQCMAKAQASNFFCSEGGAPCLPTCTGDPKKDVGGCVDAPKAGEDPSPAFCVGQCTRDPRIRLTATASDPNNNVLRSPDGKPFAVRLYVVDIGSVSTDDVQNSMSLAISGGGKLLGADASDPAQFLGALDKAFDLKNKNICGIEL
jgi:hypothetical protein